MWSYLFRVSILSLVAALPCAASVVDTNPPVQSISAARIAQLPASQRAQWQQYLLRSNQQMQRDRAVLAAELKQMHASKPIIPPSGSSAHSLPLGNPATWYGSAEAKHIADIVLSFQTPAGGWSKNLDLAAHLRQRGEQFAPDNLSKILGPDDFDTPHDPNWNYVGTIDNDATTTEMQFLAKVIVESEPAESAPYRASFLRCVRYLLAAQFPNGGWPQVWPLEGGYHDTITYNDDAMIHVMKMLQEVANGKGDYAFVPAPVRAQAAASVRRGVQCILATQIVVRGQRTVWAQQHDALTLQPASGRNFEPPVPCSSESASILIFLMNLPHPDAQVVSAVDAGIHWLQKVAIYGSTWRRGANGRGLFPAPGAGPLWARFYAIGTDKPVFGDRDKTIHDQVSELSAERRNGYAWYGTGPQRALDRYKSWHLAHTPKPAHA
ncbi:MAG: pectate lyase [Acidobacteriaceae bacterium]